MTAPPQSASLQYSSSIRTSPYDRWVASTGLPVHEGYYLPDARKLALAPWAERECDSAFSSLAGQEGFTEARVSELRPGANAREIRLAFDEAVYVLEGK